MDWSVTAPDITQALFRWIHIIAGITWIGLLYFFNWVNANFAKTLDGETKKKVVPELLPRALYFFRWGAAWTWFSGVVLLAVVFYHGQITLADPAAGWGAGAIVMIVLTFLGVFLYDALFKSPLAKNAKVAATVGYLLIAAFICATIDWGAFSYRGYVIHTGTLFGTIMAFNVWFRIWPAQKQIIQATKEGTAPDASLVALAGLRSRHNTYLSVPLIWTMINAHTTFAADRRVILMVVILLGWHIVWQLYKRSGKVAGF